MISKADIFKLAPMLTSLPNERVVIFLIPYRLVPSLIPLRLTLACGLSTRLSMVLATRSASAVSAALLADFARSPAASSRAAAFARACDVAVPVGSAL